MRIFFLILFLTLSHHSYAFGLIRDSETELVLKEISDTLVKSAGLSSSSVNFYIIDSPELNAFVMGGQNVFITTGLIAHSDTPDIITGVIAHELGHIVGGHIITTKNEMANAQKKMILASLLGAAAGIVAKSPEVAVGGANAAGEASLLQFLKFNRAQESAADLTGLKIMKKSGYSSEGLLSFLQHLDAENRSFNDKSKSYLSTHPLSHERIDFIRNHAAKDSKGFSPKLLKDFFRVNAKIRAFTNDPRSVIKTATDDSTDSLYAKSIAYYRLGNVSKSLEIMDILTTSEPKNPFFYEQKGQLLYENNRINDAITNYKKAHSLRPKDANIKLSLATALISKNAESEHAISLLENVALIEPNNSFVWHQLSIVYHRKGDKVYGNIALGWEAMLKGDKTTAAKMVAILKNEKSMDKKAARRFEELKEAVSLMKDEDQEQASS